MLFALFLLSYDSLPPLPDLSRISFPEPMLWIDTPGNTIDLTMYTGQCTDAIGALHYHNMHVSGSYTDRLNWDKLHYSTGKASVALGFPHLHLEPACAGIFMKHDDEYLCITPSLTFASTNPHSVIQGYIEYSFWKINSSKEIEAKTMFDIIFDRIQYKPQLLLPGVYINNHYTQACAVKFHIRNFHISALSPVSDYFPSPCFRIEYLLPAYRIAGEIRSGAVIKTLKDRFDPLIPLHYTTTNPTESLRVEVRISTALKLSDHAIKVDATYRDWYNLEVPSSYFVLREMLDVKDLFTDLSIHNRFDVGKLHVLNTVHGTYIWRDTSIPFRPRYTVVDTFTLEYAMVFSRVSIEYRTMQKGLDADLPAILLVQPSFGVRFRSLTFFGTIMNSTGADAQYYDGYPVPTRAFAGGIRFKTTF